MTIILSSANWSELWEESWQHTQSADLSDNSDEIMPCPTQLAQGYKRNIGLRNGIHLTLHNYIFNEDVITVDRQSYQEDCLEWVFNLSSTFKFCNNSYVTPGKHYVAGLFMPAGESLDIAGERRLEVDIHLEPEFFKALVGVGTASVEENRFDLLPLDLQRMLNGDESVPFSLLQNTTPTMQLVLEQILNCPYQGLTKQLYLESKSLEILALYLDLVTAEPQKSKLPVKLQLDDIDRIHQAKDILLQNAQHPPSLLELARKVGMNDCTLKRGFRQVFGTTVFGYLHDYRMHRARQLLEAQTMSVQEVARAVGYVSSTSFHTAFRKKFGTNPGTYLAASRRKVV
ncbi:AraC family transcriptional regulator [Chlorogloeopsis sp. ULAP01]|uniref:helix-turn-helix transcriptional regulator n=1 Tax=Chlorogloeopsis sp. ULAP01 TaxID=3056483 RepID=UPI0025AB0B41|nr:AraC family transcriptional regulator [Chlorogloeopsis sp. ULAP01]MDM9382400.1 AraC family transcriptional regulator [Chlorogloeopsis sp. ULAP01]